MSNREHFMAVVDLICKRPGMFTGTESLRSVANYLDGLEHGLALANGEELPRHMAWYRWLEGEYIQGLQGQQWTEFLSERFGSDRAVLESLPRLYREFFADLDAIGEVGIHDRASQRILARQAEGDPHASLN